MKLLFDAREGTRNLTGIGTYVRNLVREIRALRPPGVQCRCLPEDPVPVRRPDHVSRPVQALNFLRNVAWKQLVLPSRARREGADVLVCMDPLSPLAGSIPTAVIIYDLIFMSRGAQSDAWTRYWRLLVPRCARRADLVFTLSQASKREITARLGIPEEKIVVFRTGVADHFRPPAPGSLEEVRRRLDLPGSFLLTVGAHDPRRNVKVLLAALRRIKARRGSVPKLVVVGPKTPYFEQVLQATRLLGLEGDVLYRDYVPNEDLPHYYGLATLYLYPSSEEGFGLTPLEAMACGCPVVTSRSSSLPEVVGEAAVLVDPTDPAEIAEIIEGLLEDKEKRKHLARLGLAHARNFSWKAGAEDILEASIRLAEKARAEGRGSSAGARKRDHRSD